MALFKSLRGKRENLPSTKIDGYAYFCTDDGTFWIDYKDENNVVQRKQINAKDAETLMGASISTILNSSDVEIPTSKAVLDALVGKVPDGGITGQILKKTETGTEWADASFKPEGKSYLTFSSPNSFTLKVNDTTKHWDGTLEYFTADRTWTTWDGTTTLSAVADDGEYVLYLRGTGNTVITGNDPNYRWILTGSNIACIGNIENLLDYSTVESGNHPTMADYCYTYMFPGCTSLTQAPALPATTLASSCYYSMFQDCTSLTQAPALPATTLADRCYGSMFYGCTSLKLSSSKTDEYTQEYRIPSSGTGTTAKNALIEMFTNTGGTFTGTPEINTTYYLSSDNMIVRETEISTLNGYIGSMIEGLATQEYVDGKVPNGGTTGQVLKKTETGTEWADEKSNKAIAFTVTLSASGWSGKAQTVSDARFLTGNYAYSVAPDSGSFAPYGESVIYADNVTTAGQMQFHCGEVPTADLTVNVMRIEVSA